MDAVNIVQTANIEKKFVIYDTARTAHTYVRVSVCACVSVCVSVFVCSCVSVCARVRVCWRLCAREREQNVSV